jgi:hypothetical protein
MVNVSEGRIIKMDFAYPHAWWMRVLSPPYKETGEDEHTEKSR